MFLVGFVVIQTNAAGIWKTLLYLVINQTKQTVEMIQNLISIRNIQSVKAIQTFSSNSVIFINVNLWAKNFFERFQLNKFLNLDFINPLPRFVPEGVLKSKNILS